MQNIPLSEFLNKENRSWYFKIMIFFMLLGASNLSVSCNDDPDPDPVPEVIEGTEITNFSFLKANNPSLDYDILLDIENNSITGRVPLKGTIKNLVATFEHNGSEVMVNNMNQMSDITLNDFSKVIDYQVKTTDGRTADYAVNITYYTGLPIVYLNTNGVAIDSKEEYREGFVSIYGAHNFEDLADTAMKIRGRGNSTWYFHPKKAFQLKFGEETAFLGIPKEKKWIFLAEHSDKTLVRNKIAFELGYLSNLDWTPESHFADVFINDAYNGTYHISQKVEEGDSRVALGNTGYLMEIDQLERMEADDVFFRTGNFLINIKEPEVTYDSNEFNYAKDLLNTFETVLNSNQFADPTTGYAKYIDIDSFVDWYLISEITKNQDSKSWSSIFLHVIPGEKIKMGPLWDFDLAFGNVDYSECEYPEGFWVKDHKWYERLFQDPAFVSKVKTRFAYFRENQNLILEKIDAYTEQLQLSQRENNNKWNVIGNYVWPNPVVYNTYEEEVAHLKSWYTKRMDWLETAFNNL